MDTIKIAGNPESNAAQELQVSEMAKNQAAPEIRALGDWELILVAGGDATPCWP